MKFTRLHINKIFTTATLLMLFAASGAALVGLTFIATEEDIIHNEKLILLRKLNTIIPAEIYDNDLLLDTIMLKPSSLLGTNEKSLAYRARNKNNNVAVVLSSIAPNGYNGPIHLLVGIKADGKVSGVRVVKHRETPGLGDVVEISRSNWILGFNERSRSNPDEKDWKVKRDGGVFDQFTGATITPRAVVKAVHNALLYFEQNKIMLFSSPELGKEHVLKDKGLNKQKPEELKSDILNPDEQKQNEQNLIEEEPHELLKQPIY